MNEKALIEELQALIRYVYRKSMAEKVITALHALETGVSQAVITDLKGLKVGGGTVFSK